MIVDASAVVSIAFAEPDAEIMADALSVASVRRMSVVNWLEVVVRLDRKGDAVALARFAELEKVMEIALVPATAAQGRLARAAYQRYGKGKGHPARLNLGDCMAYALARESGEPLLFKGDDFSRTDIEPALKR